MITLYNVRQRNGVFFIRKEEERKLIQFLVFHTRCQIVLQQAYNESNLIFICSQKMCAEMRSSTYLKHMPLNSYCFGVGRLCGEIYSGKSSVNSNCFGIGELSGGVSCNKSQWNSGGLIMHLLIILVVECTNIYMYIFCNIL